MIYSSTNARKRTREAAPPLLVVRQRYRPEKQKRMMRFFLFVDLPSR
jgi:hypothetical protein